MKEETNAVKVEIDLTKPVTTLIEKIAGATGILYEPARIKKKAKAEAEARVVLAKATARAHSIEDRAIQRLIKQESKRQSNIEAVVAGSLPHIDSTARPEEIENDWVANFFEKSKDISDEEMRNVWSRLLAGETNSPGAFSKRTVNLLAELDKRDAVLFTNLAQFTLTVYGGQVFPYVQDLKDEIYTKTGIDFEELQHLDSLGLINFNNVAGYSLEQPGSKGGQFLVEYRDRKAWVKVPEERNSQLSTGHVMYTRQGLELLKISSPQKNPDIWEYLLAKVSKAGMTVTEA